MKSDLVDLCLALHADTERAVLVSPAASSSAVRGAAGKTETFEEASAVWLPKSQVEICRATSPSSPVRGDVAKGVNRDGQLTLVPLVTVTMPERLAVEKGLI